jgi:hypothetical protein
VLPQRQSEAIAMILDDLYASEINFKIATDWDGGWNRRAWASGVGWCVTRRCSGGLPIATDRGLA